MKTNIYLVAYALKWRTGVARVRATSPKEAKRECQRLTGAKIRTMTICEICPDGTKSDN